MNIDEVDKVTRWKNRETREQSQYWKEKCEMCRMKCFSKKKLKVINSRMERGGNVGYRYCGPDTFYKH